MHEDLLCESVLGAPEQLTLALALALDEFRAYYLSQKCPPTSARTRTSGDVANVLYSGPA